MKKNHVDEKVLGSLYKSAKLLIVLVVGFGIAGCGNTAVKAIPPTKELAANEMVTAIFPGAIADRVVTQEPKCSTNSVPEPPVASKHFRTDATADDVQAFYAALARSLGWGVTEPSELEQQYQKALPNGVTIAAILRSPTDKAPYFDLTLYGGSSPNFC